MAYNSDDIYISRAFVRLLGSGGLSPTVATVTSANSPFTVSASTIIFGQGDVTVQLSSTVGLENQLIVVQNETGTGSVTILPGPGQTIEGVGSAVLTTTGETVMYVLRGTNWEVLFSVGGGGAGGDVVGPATATDLAVARFDGISGKLIQNSVTTISDTGVIAFVPSNVKLPASGIIITNNATPAAIITVTTTIDTTYSCRALISCFSTTDNTNTGTIDCVFKVKNISGTVTASSIGPLNKIADNALANISASITVAGINFSLNVVGIVATNLRWNATLEYVAVSRT